MCLQGSTRSGQQFGVIVETFTGSHQQNKCFPSEFDAILSRGEKHACHFTFLSSFIDDFIEGGNLGDFQSSDLRVIQPL